MMIKYVQGKSELKRSSVSSRTFAALVISLSMLTATIMLSTMTDNSFAQGSNNANSNATSSSSPSSGSSGGQGTAAAGMSLNCQSIASTIGGIVVPNPSKICDGVIPRQAPTIMGPGNMNMNKFSLANSIVEVASVSDLMSKSNQGGGSSGASSAAVGGSGNSTAATGGRTPSGSASSGTGNQTVFVMGEFALLEPQLIPMVKAAVGSNWTIEAVHNHLVLEKPKMMFVHWSAQGDLNTITSQIKSALLMVSRVPSSSG